MTEISTYSHADPLPLDALVQRVGLGRYQHIVYLILGVHYLCDGAEAIAISLLNVVLQQYWDLSDAEVSSLGSAVFFGCFIGTIVSGTLSDNIGRKQIFMVNLGISFCASLISAFAPNFSFMLLCRAIYGLTVGCMMPCFAAYMTEITPGDMRGKALAIVASLFTVGELIAWILSLFCLDSYTSGNWRLMLFWVALPNFISLVVAFYYLEESPRFAIFQDLDKGLEILNKMHKLNHKGRELKLDSEDRNRLKNWIRLQNENQKENLSSIKSLFNKQNKMITIKLWIIWFVLSFVYYGIIFILPMVYSAENVNNEQDAGLYDLFWAIAGEVPAYAFCYWMVEHPKFGRKNTLTISFVSCAIINLLAVVSDGILLNLLLFLARTFSISAFTIIYTYTTEMYHTKYRTTGHGIANAASRIGGVFMPWVSILAFRVSSRFPFVVYALCCACAAVACFLMPYDTQGRELDKVEQELNVFVGPIEKEVDKKLME